MSSLRGRFLLLVGVAVITAIAAVAFISSLATRMQFARFFVEVPTPCPPDSEIRLEQLREPLEAHFQRTGSWQGSDLLVEALAGGLDGDLLLLDADNRLAAVSNPELAAVEATLSPPGVVLTFDGEEDQAARKVLNYRVPHLELRDASGHECGTAVVLPGVPPDAEAAAGALLAERGFFEAVNRLLLTATVVLGLLLLVAAWIATRRLLRPVEALTRAAGEMARGNLDCRVSVASRDELGQLAAAFNSMADNLARVEGLRRDMVSDIAHELRTPLTSIRCQLEAVQDGLAETSQELIDSVHEETMLLGRLVHDLQELALAEAGQLPMEPAGVDLAAEIEAAIRPLVANGGADSARVVIDLPSLPEGWFDAKRLRQVVRNLVENALLHTSGGDTVTVSAERAGAEIRVCVTDTGSGILPEDLPHVFERFYRADRSRARSSGGTGLGLSIVRQVVEAHGGRVRVESEAGRGSVFEFTVPARHGDQA